MQLGLERAEEALDDAVVPAIARAAHARPHPVLPQDGLVALAGVLHAAVGVMQHAAADRASCERLPQRGEREGGVCRVRGPAHDAARGQVEQHREVEPAFGRPQGGDVARPDPIGPRHGKRTGQVIRRHGLLMRAVRRHPIAPAPARYQPADPHQATHPAVTQAHARRPQRALQPRPAIGAATLGMRDGQTPEDGMSCWARGEAGRCSASVIAAGTDLERATQTRTGKCAFSAAMNAKVTRSAWRRRRWLFLGCRAPCATPAPRAGVGSVRRARRR